MLYLLFEKFLLIFKYMYYTIPKTFLIEKKWSKYFENQLISFEILKLGKTQFFEKINQEKKIEKSRLRAFPRTHSKNSTCQISSQFLTFLNCWKPISVHCTGLGCLKAVLRMRLTQLCVCFWLWDAYYVSGISIVGCTTLRKDTIISGYLLHYVNSIIFPCFDSFSQFLTILTQHQRVSKLFLWHLFHFQHLFDLEFRKTFQIFRSFTLIFWGFMK